jgi:ADP-ribosyl-[dinitrogen reductase] hydrolase
MVGTASEGARDREDRLTGALLGMAVGDALGLPMEGMSARRARRMFGGELRHRLVLGRGMISDDTEHACMVAQALLVAPDDAERFARSLAWRLRWWLVGLPAAVGFGTLRAILKLWMGFPPRSSGVRSAGNGPAMRAPMIGAFFAEDGAGLAAAVKASTRLTHRDARAETGALVIALATAAAVRSGARLDAAALIEDLIEELIEDLIVELRGDLEDEELTRALRLAQEHLQRGAEPSEYAAALGLSKGITGYIHHTVPVALYCWLRTPDDFRRAITSIIALGGDTDTTAAIVGGMAGARVGSAGIPAEWLDGLADWPRSVSWLRKLGARLSAQRAAGADSSSKALGPLRLFWPGLLARNVVFTAIVLLHGLRRMLPPY